MSKITNDGSTRNPMWHKMLYSCSHPCGNSGRQRVMALRADASWSTQHTCTCWLLLLLLSLSSRINVTVFVIITDDDAANHQREECWFQTRRSRRAWGVDHWRGIDNVSSAARPSMRPVNFSMHSLPPAPQNSPLPPVISLLAAWLGPRSSVEYASISEDFKRATTY